MRPLEIKGVPKIIQVLAAAFLVGAVDFLSAERSDGSMLIALLFWACVGQGIIALSAAAEVASGKWIKNIRPYLLDYYPYLAIFPIVFLVYSRHITIYAWNTGEGYWWSPSFFIIRNTAALLFPLIMARYYARSLEKESPRIKLFAGLYLLSFVISQSFMAFEIVMSLEYPWVNTLFGGFFFVESLYAGIAFSVLLAGLFKRRDVECFFPAFKDLTVMIMGFALMWAGLFYSQYLVIWYGNIPEEVSYIAERMHIPAIKNMGLYTLLSLFLVPFLGLISRKMKADARVVSAAALSVLSGLMVERIIYIVPAVQINIIPAALPLAILGIPYLYSMIVQYMSLSSPPVEN